MKKKSKNEIQISEGGSIAGELAKAQVTRLGSADSKKKI